MPHYTSCGYHSGVARHARQHRTFLSRTTNRCAAHCSLCRRDGCWVAARTVRTRPGYRSVLCRAPQQLPRHDLAVLRHEFKAREDIYLCCRPVSSRAANEEPIPFSGLGRVLLAPYHNAPTRARSDCATTSRIAFTPTAQRCWTATTQRWRLTGAPARPRTSMTELLPEQALIA